MVIETGTNFKQQQDGGTAFGAAHGGSGLESALHLYQPVRYQAADGSWHASFGSAAAHSGHQLTWDPAAVLSILSFGYVCGDRTLVKEVRRQPWLSDVDDGQVRRSPIPEHGRRWLPPGQVAHQLETLLSDEAEQACRGRKEIYVLLSGGMDSRIVAAIAGKLYRQGALDAKPVCVTWGVADCRDVVYAREVAQNLELDWIHLKLAPEDLARNVVPTAEQLGAMVSPAHIHRLDWFSAVPRDALVLAGSYGDMVGRAEFSGSHLLELRPLSPCNAYGLLGDVAAETGYEGLVSDLDDLRLRAPGRPPYVACEHEMHGHYTRGILGHCMNLANSWCTIYQMFTAPETYGFMWALHPVVRNDAVYAAMLEDLDPRLARLPWARTNKALRGRTAGAELKVNPRFNDYNRWIASALADEFERALSRTLIAATDVFDLAQIKCLAEAVKQSRPDPRFYDGYDIFAWLATLPRFVDWLNSMNIEIRAEPSGAPTRRSRQVLNSAPGAFRARARSIAPLYRTIKNVRRMWAGLACLLRYPPEGGWLWSAR